MKKCSLQSLSKGIKLEKSETLVPWKTRFTELGHYGNAELRKQTGKEIVVWKNEEILNGLLVDLSVVYDTAECGSNKTLKSVSAYLSESDFHKAVTQLGEQLKRKAKFVRLNELEYEYHWRINGCKLVLSHVDRFGSYFKLDICYDSRFQDLLTLDQLKRFFPYMKSRPKMPSFLLNFLLPEVQMVSFR